jgi:cysteine synthase
VLFEAIIMPDDVALEKVKALESLGADIERVRPASIVDKKQASQRPSTSPSIVAYGSCLSCSML